MRHIPIVAVLKSYTQKKLKADAIAGLTTAVMIIPQGMAYALLAGLPAYVGLYAATVPLLGYALLGTSRTLAVGPTAIDSLLTATALGTIVASGTDRYMEICALLAFMVGGIQVLLGLLRAGFVVRLLSTPVIKGFTSAAALIIAINQLKLVLGISFARSAFLFDILLEAWQRLQEINWSTLSIALCTFVVLDVCKRVKPSIPRAILVVGMGGIAVVLFSLEERGVDVIGTIPSGLPAPQFPQLNKSDVLLLFPSAFMIAIVAFMEAISISNTLLREGEERPSPNNELIGIGTANALAGLFHGLPVTGGFSRSAVNADAGVETQLAGVITAAIVAFVLAFVTPWLYFIPKAVLGAIIITSVLGLIDHRAPFDSWRTSKLDFYVLLGTFMATLLLGIQQGIAVGVFLALLSHITIQVKQPLLTVIAPGEVQLCSTIFFANVDGLELELWNALGEEKTLIVRAEHLKILDVKGVIAFQRCFQRMNEQGIEWHWINLDPRLEKRLQLSETKD
jgi:sulfate permease, SulP family